MTIFYIVEELDFYTLQFYHRLATRYHDIVIVSFDEAWLPYIKTYHEAHILPRTLLVKKPVKLQASILRKEKNFYDVFFDVSNNLKVLPNSEYTVRIKYSTLSDAQRNSVLSINFFGDSRDFDQQHLALQSSSRWQQTEAVLTTGDFRSNEKVNFRAWNCLSDDGVKIQIHDIDISQEIVLKNQLAQLLENRKIIFSQLHSSLFNGISSYLRTLQNCKELDRQIMLNCRLPAQSATDKFFCGIDHANQHKRLLCEAIGLDHVGAGTNSVTDQRIFYKDKQFPYAFDTTPDAETFSLLTPCETTSHDSVRNMLVFCGTKTSLASLQAGIGQKMDRLNCAYWEPKETRSLETAQALVLVEPQIDGPTMEIVLLAWTQGCPVLSLFHLPTKLKRAPIKTLDVAQIKSQLQNQESLSTNIEKGYLIARSRSREELRKDFFSLIRLPGRL